MGWGWGWIVPDGLTVVGGEKENRRREDRTAAEIGWIGLADLQARPRYEPSSVFTLMRSPGLMKRGTWTTRPVSMTAAL